MPAKSNSITHHSDCPPQLHHRLCSLLSSKLDDETAQRIVKEAVDIERQVGFV